VSATDRITSNCVTERHFPPPWTVEEQSACFVVRDGNGQALAYIYFEDATVRELTLRRNFLRQREAKMKIWSRLLLGVAGVAPGGSRGSRYSHSHPNGCSPLFSEHSM
jgi:hypothetical protein